jgi:hypothetical protein
MLPMLAALLAVLLAVSLPALLRMPLLVVLLVVLRIVLLVSLLAVLLMAVSAALLRGVPPIGARRGSLADTRIKSRFAHGGIIASITIEIILSVVVTVVRSVVEAVGLLAVCVALARSGGHAVFATAIHARVVRIELAATAPPAPSPATSSPPPTSITRFAFLLGRDLRRRTAIARVSIVGSIERRIGGRRNRRGCGRGRTFVRRAIRSIPCGSGWVPTSGSGGDGPLGCGLIASRASRRVRRERGSGWGGRGGTRGSRRGRSGG